MTKAVIICIIDDDTIYQFTATKMIQSNALAKKVIVFSDGEEAINFFIDNVAEAENIPDIVFLDLNMPIMNGWDFLEEYIKLKPRLPKKVTIYIVSSSVSIVDLEKAKAITDVSDYIIKPIHPDTMREIVNALEKEENK